MRTLAPAHPSAGAVGRHRVTPSVLIAAAAALALAVSGGVLQLR